MKKKVATRKISTTLITVMWLNKYAICRTKPSNVSIIAQLFPYKPDTFPKQAYTKEMGFVKSHFSVANK
jgi:hypothetical protein